MVRRSGITAPHNCMVPAPWYGGYTILYYTILYYTILYYTILSYPMLSYAILYYTILYYTILYYTILYYTILYYTILHYTILYYTILYYTTILLYYTILYDAIPYHTIQPPFTAAGGVGGNWMNHDLVGGEGWGHRPWTIHIYTLIYIYYIWMIFMPISRRER